MRNSSVQDIKPTGHEHFTSESIFKRLGRNAAIEGFVLKEFFFLLQLWEMWLTQHCRISTPEGTRTGR